VLYLCEQQITDDRRNYPDILRRAEASGQAAPVSQTDILNSVPLALAVFDSDQILRQYNDAYAQLWDLSDGWLNTQPSLVDILNRLRERRKLPEQRQFGEWLKIQTDGFAGQTGTIEDVWHLPDGRSVRILMRRQPGGGRLFIFRDISDALRLETSFNLLTQVQKATLDTLDEGVAIFGTDGRLVLHNGIFAGMWRLTDGELAPQPHFTEIADLCAVRIGRDVIWEVVAEGISSTALERFREWSKLRRADDRIISLSLSRLPNGATLARFTDMTDLEKFTAIQSDAAGAVA
jgi:PAS domain-containing protein